MKAEFMYARKEFTYTLRRARKKEFSYTGKESNEKKP